MMEKIKIADALSEWPDSSSVSKLVGLGRNITPGNLFSNQLIPNDSFLVGDEGMSYAVIKSLGRKGGDGVASVLLVSSYNSNQRNDFRGVVGRIFALRGHAAAGLAVYIWDVVCVTAYNAFKFSHSDTNLKCGKCTYNGENYIAIQLGYSAYTDIFFTGFYSGNCVFLNVLESEITWIG